jgi:Cu/Ag efflux protein CusF
VVYEPIPDQGLIALAHDPIEGLMDSMIMVTPVSNPGLLQGLRRGDHVRFTLQIVDNELVVTEIRRI